MIQEDSQVDWYHRVAFRSSRHRYSYKNDNIGHAKDELDAAKEDVNLRARALIAFEAITTAVSTDTVCA